MLKPYLFIGVGGSGGKTLRYLHREMERRLRASGNWHGPIPGAWGFLHIDVPDKADGREVRDIPPGTLEGANHYVGLAEQELYSAYDEILERADALDQATHGWKPDPDTVTQVWLGAKQFRAVGRVMALSNFAQMRTRVEQAFTALTAPSNISELESYANKIGARLDTTPQVVVVSSLGGGAGSGIFLDVMEMVRLIVEPVEPLSVLYSPEIFDDIGKQAGAGIAPNSLAAISELISGFEHEGPLHASEDGLLAMSGIGRIANGRRAFLQNLIIGSRNEHLRLPDGPSVFRATGKAMASFVMNPDISDTFGTYLTANQRMAVALRERRTESVTPAPEAPFSSFGYSSVGLGRPLFNEYAAQRLAAAALLRLERGHVDDAPVGEVVDDEAAVQSRLDREFPDFLDRCKLHERSRENNDVLDALRSKSAVEQRFKSFFKEQSQAFNEEFGKDVAKEQARKIKTFLSPPVVENADGASSKSATDQLYDVIQNELYASALAWVQDIQPVVIEQVADAIGRSGLRVATALVEQLRTEVNDVAQELRRGATTAEGKRANRIREMGSGFAKAGRRSIGANHHAVIGAFTKFEESQLARYDADLERLAAALLEDLSRKFLRPLEVALADGLDQIRQSMANTGRGSASSVVAGWPTEALNSLPPSLQPAQNEVLLIPISQFPDDFELVLQRQFGVIDEYADESAAGGFDEALDHAIDEVLTGAWFPADDASSILPDQTLIVQQRRWVAEISELLKYSSADSPRSAQMTADFRPIESLLERARDWSRNARGPVHDFATESLKDYLAYDRKKIERADVFAEKLRQAMDLAEPLVEVDITTYARNQADTGAGSLTHVISAVPLSTDHEAYKRAENAIAEATKKPADGFFDTSSAAQEIEIAAFLTVAVGPLPLQAIGESIVSSWNQAKQRPNLRSEWWRDRRSRRLSSFVPMTLERQAAFMRGWVTGVILGQIPRFDPKTTGPWQVWSPERTRNFLEHVLGRTPVDETEEPLALLETLPLAQMIAGVGDFDTLAAYERVVLLGTSDQPAGATLEPGYPALSAALATWITDGTTETASGASSGHHDVPDPNPQLAGSTTDDPDARRDAVISSVKRQRETIAAVGQLSWDEVVKTRRARRTWEVSDEFQAALTDLISALETDRPAGSGLAM